MDRSHKEVLQITKEITVKFVEVGRITPANFAEHFPSIYAVVLNTLNGEIPPLPEAPPEEPETAITEDAPPVAPAKSASARPGRARG